MGSGNSKHRKDHKKKLAARQGKIAVAKRQYGKFVTMMQENMEKVAALQKQLSERPVEPVTLVFPADTHAEPIANDTNPDLG